MSYSQKGFAPIVLVLLLFGIAAGTVLIQNGVNFLPNAQQPLTASRSLKPSYNQKSPPRCSTGEAKYCTFPGKGWTCYKDGCDANAIRDSEKFLSCPDDYPDRGVHWGQQDDCFKTLCDYSDGFTELRPPMGGATTGRCYKATTTSVNTGSQSCNPPEESRQESCSLGYRCFGDWYKDPANNCQLTPKINASTGGSFHCDKDPRCDGGMKCENNIPSLYDVEDGALLTLYDSCSDYGYICRLNSESPCRKPADEAECQKVYGKDYTINLASMTCTKKNAPVSTYVCGEDGNVYDNREGVMADNCKNKSQICSNGRCVDPPAAAPAAPGAQPAAPATTIGGAPVTGGVKPATGTQPTTGAGTATTGCEEFKDGNDLGIPCYKIGTFSPEDLAATEADAKIALSRYDQFNQILSDVKGKISNEIAEAARIKTEEAQEKAKACVPK